MRVLVIGSGYVGLVAAACFAEAGYSVLGVDVNASKVERLQKGEIPIFEPGLDVIFKRHLASGRLTFSSDLKNGIAEADVVFICVGTPQSEDGSADLRFVMQVAEQIGMAMSLRPKDAKPLIIVDKSTVPVGTAARVSGIIAGTGTDRAFEVVSNPEFLREGSAIQDFYEARSCGSGLLHRFRRRHDEGALRTILEGFGWKVVPHGPRIRRTHQVRRQRHAGLAHQLHQ